MREIDINNQSAIVVTDVPRLRRFVRALDELLPKNLKAPSGYLSIAILDDPAIAKVHAEFLRKPTPTDVITFEGEHDGLDAGEVCVGAETALRECLKYGFTPDRELCLYVAHGYMHLAGVNDIEPEDALKMRAAEAEAMKILDRKFRAPIFKFQKH